LSRKLLTGLFAIVIALAATIWALVLVREETGPQGEPRASASAAPDSAAAPPVPEPRAVTPAPAPVAAQPPAPQPARPAVVAAPPAILAPTPATQPSAASPAQPSRTAADVSTAPAQTSVAPAPAPPALQPPAAQTADAVPVRPATAPAPARATEPPPAQTAARTADAAPVRPATEPAPARATEPPPAQTAAQPSAKAPEAAPVVSPAPPAVASLPPATAPLVKTTGPSFDVVRVAADGNAVIAGRAQPGAVVVVLDGDTEIARVTADARGEWVALPARPLASGTRELSLLARTADDPAGLRSDRVVVVVVPERQPAVASRGSPSGAVAVAVPRDGEAGTPSRLLQVPSAEPRGAPPLPVTVETVDYDSTGEVVLSGRAPAGSAILLYLDGVPIGRTEGDANGRWTMRPQSPVSPGVYTLRVDQITGDGRVAQRIEIPFARAEPPRDAAAASERVVVQPGNSLWRIARRVYGAGVRYTVIYQANRDMIRDPDLIYPGQIFVLPEKQ
jgi:nucleoid-associated protein YgaU